MYFQIKISLLSEFKRSSYNYRHANQLEGLTGNRKKNGTKKLKKTEYLPFQDFVVCRI